MGTRGTALALCAAVATLLACQPPWQRGERACADAARLEMPMDRAGYSGRIELWPFGVHGGAHPEGHPGIDFVFAATDSADGGLAVLAPLTAEILSITPETDYPGSACLVLDSACIEVNLCHVRLAAEAGLKAGGSVRRGQRLGTVGRASGEERYSLHFGAYSGKNADLMCPADFLDPDTVRCRLGQETGAAAPAACGALTGSETWLGQSHYAETSPRSVSVACADGSAQTFILPAETGLCNPRLAAADRARMQTCLGSACAGVW